MKSAFGSRNLGRKLARKYRRSLCTIKRKTALGWITVYTGVPVLVVDESDRPPRPDAWDAGSDNVRTWALGFALGFDIRMRDQVHDLVMTDDALPPILTIATQFQTDVSTMQWVVAHAEDSAVEKLPIVFYRRHADDSETTHGPFMMTVDWEDVAGTDPDNYAAISHLSTAILTGDADVDVRYGDRTDMVDGRYGTVIEIRREIAGRREFRARFDIGARQ
jgi:hypothetical protein